MCFHHNYETWLTRTAICVRSVKSQLYAFIYTHECHKYSGPFNLLGIARVWQEETMQKDLQSLYCWVQSNEIETNFRSYDARALLCACMLNCWFRVGYAWFINGDAVFRVCNHCVRTICWRRIRQFGIIELQIWFIIVPIGQTGQWVIAIGHNWIDYGSCQNVKWFH